MVVQHGAAQPGHGCHAADRDLPGCHDVQVEPVAQRPGCVLLLEPDGRRAPERVDHVLLQQVVAQHPLPEGHDHRRVERVHRQLDVLDRSRVRAQPQVGGRLRDRARHLQVHGAKTVVLRRERDPDPDAVGADVDVHGGPRALAVELGQPTREAGARAVGGRGIPGGGAPGQDAPVAAGVGALQVEGGEWLAHEESLPANADRYGPEEYP